MKAWRRYHEQGRERVNASQESDHQERVTVAQRGMIFSVMRSAGLASLSESNIETQAYLSKKFVERDKVYLRAADMRTARSTVCQVMFHPQARAQVSAFVFAVPWGHLSLPMARRPPR
jgi:hypothetical protein